MIRARFFARTALGLVVALGVAAGTAAPASAKDKDKDKPAEIKVTPSKAFIPVYQGARTALEAAEKRADVIAAHKKAGDAITALNEARGKQAVAAARTAYEAALTDLQTLLAPEKAQVDKVMAAATTPDDRYFAGALLITYGNLSFDKAAQRTGIQAKIESGKIAPADLAAHYLILGRLAFDAKDFAAARVALQAATAAGSKDDDIVTLTAESYIQDNQVPAGLKVFHDATTSAGSGAREFWLSYGAKLAYRSKQPDEAGFFATRLVELYPTVENWSLAIVVVRDMYRFAGQDSLDLLRLMGRTKSFLESRDYIDYLQAADPRRLPGESLKVINEGVAAGMLDPKDLTVSDSKAQATGRIAADKAGLPLLEKDARAANSNVATVMAAGDTFLSYDDAAKAEEFYGLALTKPGVDANRANLRLGIAQADQGKWADAQASFAKVTDARSPIARLWAAFAQAKAAGK